MLVSLSIRDIVLIDRLDLTFHAGLCVLTGETGAGKSILLDALGLALGDRGDAALVRPGCEQATVSAAFDVAGNRVVAALLAERGFASSDTLLLRRVLVADGRSRAFINDEPASVGLLREIGAQLAQIQVQSESHALLQPANHRALLDGLAGHADLTAAVGSEFDAWRVAVRTLAEAEAAHSRAGAEGDFLRHAVGEFDALEPADGEEETLAKDRELLRHGEKLLEAIGEAQTAMNGQEGIGARLRAAERHLSRASGQAMGRLDEALRALERAAQEVAEADAAIESAARGINLDPGRLEAVEHRLFALRALARKYRCTVADLPAKRAELAAALQLLEQGDIGLASLRRTADETRAVYRERAEKLSKARQRSAKLLDRAVAKELSPLKLEKARFRTLVAPLEEDDWGREGMDRVTFEASTNPEQPFAPLAKVASGGELSRFMLALQVVLADRGPATTLVFDEADSGVGGATADAVGERLARLARRDQVLVVTHSPQVAARGQHHWRIVKLEVTPGSRRVATRVEELSHDSRREEIARMLAGAEVTAEARAAADRLLRQSETRPGAAA